MENKDSFQPAPKNNNKTYHAFISHKSDCKPWVKTLVKNLNAQGFDVFLDEWEIQPGKSWLQDLSHGIDKSQKGILVITPNAMDSGWVKTEYEAMLIRMKKDPAFKIIPVVLAKPVPDFPFIETIQWIDFSDPGNYNQAFYRLVCALEDKTPGSAPVFKAAPEIPGLSPGTPPKPGPDEIAFIEELFKMLFERHILVLLTRGNHSHTSAKELILEKAGRLFGPGNVLHLAPAYGPHVEMREYFSLLSQQCRLSPPAQSPVSFQARLEELLADNHEIFLLISRFEHSSSEIQEELAAILRSLGERFARSLRVVICGAERLYELAYVGPYQPYLDDPLLKELYWKNLLQKDRTGARLTWRSEALRLAAQKIISPCRGPNF